MNNDELFGTVKMSNWTSEQNELVRRLIAKLGEESAELANICCRILAQGLDQSDPSTKIPNTVSLQDEIADVDALSKLAIELLNLDNDTILMRSERKASLKRGWITDGTVPLLD